ncbi:hypothetical protein [Paremcibacter congregatus]|jgi:hypothetical protein|uniref:hypothetical protein n=1 Tax=Paremcibacter congregatus TaxID=2043170 RepID=UPI0030ECAF1E|tara:strand:+ start:7962 stop:8411 length:450 start_codon:yes stop_codon:yes gene_type:complete
MKLPLKFCLVLAGLLGLSACGGPRYQTVYDYTPPTDGQGRMCLNQCLDSKTYCERSGQQVQLEQKKVCLTEESARADAEFHHYMREMKQAGEKIEKDYYDFYRDYSCNRYDGRRSDPSCEVNYRACYQNCGGEVRAQTFCVANCDEIPQ